MHPQGRHEKDHRKGLAAAAEAGFCIYMVNQALPAAVVLFACAIPRLPAAGEFDPTYLPSVNGTIVSSALTPEGEVVIGGSLSTGSPQKFFTLARLKASDGAYNQAWGLKSGKSVPSCVALGDGGIVAGAYFDGHMGICRFLPDGSADSSFTARVDEGLIRSMAVDTDGNLLLAGDFDMLNGVGRRGFGALRPDGSLFDGYPMASMTGATIHAIAPRTNQMVYVGGSPGSPGGQLSYPLLARFKSASGLDTAYRPALPAVTGDVLNCLATQPDGSVIAAGKFTREGTTTASHLVRVFSNGSLDSSFNPVFSRGSDVPKITSVVLQADGRILVAGDFTHVNQAAVLGVVRLFANGSLDRSFQVSAAGANGLALQADGKVIITGNFAYVNGRAQSRMARLHNEFAVNRITVIKNRISWTRGGTAPISDQVTFDVSADEGATWQSLPPGRPSDTTWHVTGIDLPVSGTVRIRTRYASGYMNASSSLVEKQFSYALAPEIVVEERTAAGLTYLTDGNAEPLDFGEVQQGNPRSRTLEVYNSGSYDLTVTAVTLPAGFTWSNPPTLPVIIPPRLRLPVTIQADAVAPGAFNGTAVIKTDDADEAEFDIPLASLVTGPDIAIHMGAAELQNGQAGWVYVGDAVQGSDPSPRAFLIRNHGNKELSVNGATASAGFSVDPFPAFVLQPGEERQLYVGPDQRVTGAITGELQVLSSDPDEQVFRVPLVANVRSPLKAKVLWALTRMNRKTGLREQTVRITNPAGMATAPGVRIILRGLPDWLQVRNASDVLPDGSVVIEVLQPLAPGKTFDLVLEYEIPKKKPVVISPQVTVEVIVDVPQPIATKSGRMVAPLLPLAVEKCERTDEGHFAVTFLSIPGRSYQVEYSTDGTDWKICPPTRAAGSKVRWLDSGAPYTERAPSMVAQRLYRVRELDE